MAMAVRRYDTAFITQWRRFMAFIKANKCHQWASTPSDRHKSNIPTPILGVYFIVKLMKKVSSCPNNNRVIVEADSHRKLLPTWLRLWVIWSLLWSKWCHYVMVEAYNHLKLLPTSVLDIYKVFKHILICCPLAYNSSLTIAALHWYPPYLAQILGFCGTFKMMSLCHGWGWKPPQTSSHIHIRHVQSIGPHWFTVHWDSMSLLQGQNDVITSWLRLTAALNCFPHPY